MKNYLLYDKALEALTRRGVDLIRLAQVVYDLQSPYQKGLTVDICHENILKVLSKTEVQHTVITGIQMDELAEKKLWEGPLQTIIENDESLYGIDEILALSIVNLYGTIASTNFGYLDKLKPGIIGEYNNKTKGEVHTFLDDILSALAASACSRLAHSK